VKNLVLFIISLLATNWMREGDLMRHIYAVDDDFRISFRLFLYGCVGYVTQLEAPCDAVTADALVLFPDSLFPF
jgi:hypothetical protein